MFSAIVSKHCSFFPSFEISDYHSVLLVYPFKNLEKPKMGRIVDILTGWCIHSQRNSWIAKKAGKVIASDGQYFEWKIMYGFFKINFYFQTKNARYYSVHRISPFDFKIFWFQCFTWKYFWRWSWNELCEVDTPESELDIRRWRFIC